MRSRAQMKQEHQHRIQLDLACAVALRSVWAGLGWPGTAIDELRDLGLVDAAGRCTPAGCAVVDATPPGQHVALLSMAWELRRGRRG
jgi:hypothetical protein